MRTPIATALITFAALGATAAHAQVNPDGSFVYEIKIDTATTSGGVEPHIALQYSSLAGDGPLGVGWRLGGLPAIVRINAGDGVNYDAADSFAAPGGKLISVGTNIFHSEHEDWVRYEQSGACGAGPCTWYGFNPDGSTAEYGAGTSAAWAGTDGIRSYGLSRYSDSYNRAYTVGYLDGGGGQKYPQTITWDSGDNAIAPALTMTFTWENRPDPRVVFDQGARVTTSKRLHAITIKRGTNLVREYRLEYAVSATTGRSTLTRVREYGTDNISQTQAWTMTWSGGLQDVAVSTQYSVMPEGTYQWPLDVDGDGRADLVTIDSGTCAVNVQRAQSTNVFLPPVTTSFTCSMLPQGYIWPGDFNGDGRADLAWRKTEMTSSGITFYPEVWMLLSQGDGTFSHFTWSTSGASTYWGPADQTFAGDFDGDGVTDLATRATDGRILVRKKNGTANSFVSSYWTTASIDVGYAPNRWTGDFDGDGKTDLAFAKAVTGGIRLTLLRSTGAAFVVSQTMIGGSWDLGADSRDTYLGDFNGDGRTDFLTRADSHATTLYLHSFTGKTWYTHTITGGPLVSEPRAQGDFNGDGRTDFVECYGGGTTGYLVLSTGIGFTRVLDSERCVDASIGPSILGQAADFDGDGVDDTLALDYHELMLRRTLLSHDVIIGVDEGMPGAVAPVLGAVYTPVSQIVGAIQPAITTCGGGTGAACGRADRSPRLLVTTLIRRDGRGAEYRTAYDYYNGRVYPGRPGVAADLGFQRVRARDLQTLVYTDTWYLQTRPFHGQIDRSRTYLADADPIEPGYGGNTLIAEVINTGYQQMRCNDSGCVADNSPTGTFPRQIHAGTTTTKIYELGVPMYSTVKATMFDVYGSPSVVIDQVWKGSEVLHQHHTEHAYINKAQAPRVIGLPLRRLDYATAPSDQLDLQEYYYDNAGYGVVGQHADQTSVRRQHGSGSAPWEQTSRGYDTQGNLVYETDPRGLTTVFERTSDGRFLTAVDEPDGRTLVTVDPRSGQIVQSVTPTGVRTVRELDVNLAVSEERQEDAVTGEVLKRKRMWRDATGTQEYQCIDTGPGLGDAQCVWTLRDALGRPFQQMNSAATTVTTDYDAAGRKWRESRPYRLGTAPGGYTTYEYDAQGRVIHTFGPDGATSQTRYNDGPVATGAVTRTTAIDPLGATRITHVDGLGRPVLIEQTTTGGAMLTTGFAFDVLDHLVRITKPDGALITLGYDDQGNRTSTVEPNSGTTTFGYYLTPGVASYGQIAWELRQSPNATTGSVATQMYYDGLGRVARRVVGGDTVTTWTYDDTPAGGGRLASVSHQTPEDVVTYDFATDKLGRETWRSESVTGTLADGTPLDWQVELSTELDASDRPTAITYPDGTVATYAYPPGYDLTAPLVATLGDATVTLRDFDAEHRPQTFELGNGTVEHVGFDPVTGRVVDTAVTQGTADLARRHYTFDPRGLIASVDDQVRPELSMTYSYDPMRRLVDAVRGDGKKFHYEFDTGGNLTSKSSFDPAGDVEQLLRGVVGGTNRLADDGRGNPLDYAAAGQVIRRGAMDYRYDSSGLLTEVRSDGLVVERDLYDHDGKKVVTVAYDADGAVVTYDAAGVVQDRMRVSGGSVVAKQHTQSLFVADRRVASVISGDDSVAAHGAESTVEAPGVRYYHGDHLGSTSMVTDETGAILADVVYGPYGELDPAWGAPADARYLFTGAEQSPTTGLVHLGFRPFDPDLGCFLQPDTLVPDPSNALDFDPYLYVRGNPVSYVDPTGHFPFILIPIAIGAIAGAAIGATHGDILSHPGHWTSWDTWRNEGSFKWGAAGFVIGGLAGAGYYMIGTVGGTIFGTSLGSSLQAAAFGGALEMESAYADGHRDAGSLGFAFALGAVDGFMARTGFFGAARLGAAEGPIAKFVFYGLAMAADSLVSSSMKRSYYGSDYPIEVNAYVVTFALHDDGTWTHRWSFAMTLRYLVAAWFLDTGRSAGGMAYDFSPMHRDELYQRMTRRLGNGFLPYLVAPIIEGSLMLGDYPDVFENPTLFQHIVFDSILEVPGTIASLSEAGSNWLFGEHMIGCHKNPGVEDCLYGTVP